MTTRKKIFIIIIILIIIGGVFFFFRQRQIAKQNGQTLSFRSFFTFSKKITTDGGDTGNEQGGDFTTEGKTEVKDGESSSSASSPVKNAFGTDQPFSPIGYNGVNGYNGANGFGGAGGSGTGGYGDNGNWQGGDGNGGGTGGDNGDNGGGTGGDNPNDPPVGPGGVAPTIPECSVDDLEIVFLPEELARLKELEQQFYRLAPTLRTDQDVKLEEINNSDYKILKGRIADLADSCESVSTKLPETLDRKVATPFYSDAKKDQYFTDGPTPTDNVIDMNCRNGNRCSEVPIVLHWIEKIFRINIW